METQHTQVTSHIDKYKIPLTVADTEPVIRQASQHGPGSGEPMRSPAVRGGNLVNARCLTLLAIAAYNSSKIHLSDVSERRILELSKRHKNIPAQLFETHGRCSIYDRIREYEK